MRGDIQEQDSVGGDCESNSPIDPCPKTSSKRIKNTVCILIIPGVVVLGYLIWSYTQYGNAHGGLAYMQGYSVRAINPVINIGSIQENQTVGVSFRIQNLLSKTVSVVGMKQNCVCSTLIDQNVPLQIGPYSSEEIKMSFGSVFRLGATYEAACKIATPCFSMLCQRFAL